MSFVSSTVFSQYTIAAGSSGFTDIYLKDVPTLQCLLDMAYTLGTSSTTGLSVRFRTGFGILPVDDVDLVQGPLWYAHRPGVSPSVLFADNYIQAKDIPTFPESSGLSELKRWSFYLSSISERWPCWIRMEWINLDESKPVVLTLRANL